IPTSVSLARTSTPLTVIPGEMVNVNLAATCQCQLNSGYVLRDTIPAGFNYVSSTNGGVLSGNVVTWHALTFSTTGETKSYSVTLVASNPGCALNTAINDNRDGSTTGGLTATAITGTTNWAPSTARSSSPTTSWFAQNVAGTRDYVLT